jgi:hypothetical protein
MTEQGLIEYAKAGDEKAILVLAGAGFEGVDWGHAITHVNGGWLPGHEIKRVWGEMVKINFETGMPIDEIQTKLQAALNAHHMPKGKPISLAMLSPAGRPWEFSQQQHKLKFGKGSNRMPPKKKRKK